MLSSCSRRAGPWCCKPRWPALDGRMDPPGPRPQPAHLIQPVLEDRGAPRHQGTFACTRSPLPAEVDDGGARAHGGVEAAGAGAAGPAAPPQARARIHNPPLAARARLWPGSGSQQSRPKPLGLTRAACACRASRRGRARRRRPTPCRWTTCCRHRTRTRLPSPSTSTGRCVRSGGGRWRCGRLRPRVQARA